jgi:hypothetical protein
VRGTFGFGATCAVIARGHDFSQRILLVQIRRENIDRGSELFIKVNLFCCSC